MSGGEQRDRPRWAGTAARDALIVGGAGFVGSALADTLLREGWGVRILDNLSGRDSAANLAWLQERHRDLVDVEIADADDLPTVSRRMTGCAVVFLLVAADPSVEGDYERGGEPPPGLATSTAVVDAAAAQPERPAIIVASSHRAYGPLEDIELVGSEARFEPVDRALARHGIDEDRAGAVAAGARGWQAVSDRYLLARAQRIGLSLTVLRLGSIYGPRQSPEGPDGWVCDHLFSLLESRSPVVKGDPRRVRDILYIDDALDALIRAAARVDRLAGRLFNVGGGAGNALSVIGLHELVQQIAEIQLPIKHQRLAGVEAQRWYVSDHRRFSAHTGWQPAITPPWGLALIAESPRAAAELHPADKLD